MELCGGEARATQVCMKHNLNCGHNFDLRTGYDLNTEEGQAECMHYIQQHRPLVVLMAPTCARFGPASNMNRSNANDAWQESYRNAAPHGRFCGRVAEYQLSQGRFFLCENPHPSRLYDEPP